MQLSPASLGGDFAVLNSSVVLKGRSARPPTDRRGGLVLRRLVTPERSPPLIQASIASQRVSGHRNVFRGTADRERFEPFSPDSSPARLCGASELGSVGRSGTTVVSSGKTGCRGQSQRSNSRVTPEKASRWSGRLWRRSAGRCSALAFHTTSMARNGSSLRASCRAGIRSPFRGQRAGVWCRTAFPQILTEGRPQSETNG